MIYVMTHFRGWLQVGSMALLVVTAAPLFGQGRQAPAQTQTPATPATTPGGRGGRGGVAGPGPAGGGDADETPVGRHHSIQDHGQHLAYTEPAGGGDADETPVVTHHSIQANGKTLAYTATAALMPLKDSSGETEAHIFYVAYTLDGVTDAGKRPLAFCFNGGPGSASMWVHMGAMGPRSPKLQPNGGMPPPPYQLRDNPNTWLDQADLVFIDPVGTGYSRAKTVEVARRMNGVQGD